MTKLIALAALAFAVGTVQQAIACDMGAITTYVTGAVAACSGSDCATDEHFRQEPADCGSGANCAQPEPAPPRITTQAPLASPVTVAGAAATTASSF